VKSQLTDIGIKDKDVKGVRVPQLAIGGTEELIGTGDMSQFTRFSLTAIEMNMCRVSLSLVGSLSQQCSFLQFKIIQSV